MKNLLEKHLEYIYKQRVNCLNSQSSHKPNLIEILDKIEILYIVIMYSIYTYRNISI